MSNASLITAPGGAAELEVVHGPRDHQDLEEWMRIKSIVPNIARH